MTNKEIEKRLSDIDDILRTLAEKKNGSFLSAAFCRLWAAVSKYIIPFVLGIIAGSVWQPPVLFQQQPATLEQQAALGDAAIPFPSGKPSPMPATPLPKDSNREPSGSSWTSPSELPLPANRQADAGQTTSTRLFKPLIRRTQ